MGPKDQQNGQSEEMEAVEKKGGGGSLTWGSVASVTIPKGPGRAGDMGLATQ